MNTIKRLLPLLLVFFFVSCKKDQKVPVQFLLTDNPAAYDSVNVHITGIKVNVSQDNEAWIDVPCKDTIVNLLDLQNGITMLLAEGEIPEGVLKEVRFVLGNDNNIVVDGISHPLEAPSAEYSGLKIKIDKDLNETLNSFTLDFVANESIKEENGGYKLMPVIRLVQ